MVREILEKIATNSELQSKLLNELKNQKLESKTLKVLSAIGPIFSAILIAFVGWYFTNNYNEQQLRLAQILVIEKFAPQLYDSLPEKRLTALATIMSLNNEELALRTVSILNFENKRILLSSLFNASVNSSDYELMSRILRTFRGLIDLDEFGRDPLHIAVANRDKEMLEFLLERKFHPDIRSTDHPTTPLFDACSIGDVELVEVLLKNKANPAAAIDGEGNTALIEAVDKSHIEVINILLRDERFDIAARNDDGNDALLTALKFRVFDKTYPSGQIVKLLLNAGANPNTLTKYGTSALTVAATLDNIEAFKNLYEKGAKITMDSIYNHNNAFIKAVQMGSESVVRYLLKKGISSNMKSEYGFTPLHNVSDNVNIAQMLIDAKADVNAKTYDGITVLETLLEERQYIGMNAKERQKANRELDEGITKVLQLMLKAGVNVNEPSKYSEFPVVIAAASRGPEVLEILLKNGAKINALSGTDKKTALIAAASASRHDNVRLLLQYGADRSIKNDRGETALEVASSLLKYLKENKNLASFEGYGSISAYEATVIELNRISN